MAARLLSVLVSVLADRFRTVEQATGPAHQATRWSPHLGRIPGWSGLQDHPPVRSPVISQRFPAASGQVRPARTFVAGVLGEDHPLRDDAVLLTSELATNAVEHSSGPRDSGPVDPPREFVVTVAFIAHGVLITVQDSGVSGIPCTRNSGLDATGGRGLTLVNDLATRWGFHRDPIGTVIWFELGSPGLAE